jgi:hypothetical protein
LRPIALGSGSAADHVGNYIRNAPVGVGN